MKRKFFRISLTLSAFFLSSYSIFPKTDFVELNEKISNITVGIDTLWVLIAGFLVFFMNLGFSMMEAGLVRAKNTVNILTKNFVVFSVASLVFWFIGFGLTFGNGNSLFAKEGLFWANGTLDDYSSLSWTNIPLWAKFFFKLTFAGMISSIVSGAIAERIKFISFIIFSIVLTGFIYPVVGYWIWGGGFLFQRGFLDFAGSSAVHSVGGWAALAGVLVLGPRLGKYRKDGSTNPIFGHNISMVILGAFILWFGWFGFNAGSTMSVGNGSTISHIIVATNTAAIMAVISSSLTVWILLKKPDLSIIVNGALAGLVSITGACAYVSISSSAIIGFIAGILVVFSITVLDKLKIDDPVGAISVHLVSGVFGTLAIGLFAQNNIAGYSTANGLFFKGNSDLLLNQITGVLVVGVFTFIISFILWYLLKITIGIRITKEQEIEGLDIKQHGLEAYPDFQGFLTK